MKYLNKGKELDKKIESYNEQMKVYGYDLVCKKTLGGVVLETGVEWPDGVVAPSFVTKIRRSKAAKRAIRDNYLKTTKEVFDLVSHSAIGKQ